MPKQTHQREIIRGRDGLRHFVSPMRNWTEVLYTRQNGRCIWCGELMVRKTMRNSDGSMDGHKATIDHLVPQAMGGSDDISNLALACYTCNCLRGRNMVKPLGQRLNAAEVLIIQKDELIAAKDAEITVLITAHNAEIVAKTKQLETAGRMHKFVCKQRDRAQGQREKIQENYARLHGMIKPPAPCACWWCRLKKKFHFDACKFILD